MSIIGFMFRLVGKVIKYVALYVFGLGFILLFGVHALVNGTGQDIMLWLILSPIILFFAVWQIIRDLKWLIVSAAYAVDSMEQR